MKQLNKISSKFHFLAKIKMKITYLAFLFCYLLFRLQVAIWPVTGQGFQNTKSHNILGDPGAVSWVGRKGGTKVFK